MSDLLEFLRTHEESFRSRARLASLYSDFRHQRNTNPDGYEANTSAWLRALTAAAKAGLLPAQTGSQHDTFVLHTGESLTSVLQTQEFGRPLALDAAIGEAVRKESLLQVNEFLDAKHSIYAQSWIPTPWQVLAWSMRQIGFGGKGLGNGRLVVDDFIIVANVDAAAKAIGDRAAKIATSNTSRIFSRELFSSTFASTLGLESLSNADLNILLTHMARDKEVVAYQPSSGTIKFKATSEPLPTPITEEDISIASIRSLISSLEPQVEHLTSRVTELNGKARDAVASKQLATAKSALKSKKLIEARLVQRSATLSQLEDVYAKIEQAADQVEIVRVMESSSQTLKSLNKLTGGVERVQDVMEELKDEMMTVDEIGTAINEVSASAMDEDEVEDELAALEKVEKDKREAIDREERQIREEMEAEETRKKLAEVDDAKRPETAASGPAFTGRPLSESGRSREHEQAVT